MATDALSAEEKLREVIAAWDAHGPDRWRLMRPPLDFGQVLTNRANLMEKIIKYARELVTEAPPAPLKPGDKVWYHVEGRGERVAAEILRFSAKRVYIGIPLTPSRSYRCFAKLTSLVPRV